MKKPQGKRLFEHAIWLAKRLIKDGKDITEKMETLDYIMEVIKLDIQGVSYSKMIYFDKGYEYYDTIFPPSCYDEQGNIIETLMAKGDNAEICKQNTCLVSAIWKEQSLLESVKNIVKYGYIYHSSNQHTRFYPIFNMHISSNGGHHMTFGYFKHKAYVKCDSFDLTLLFPHVTTDGIKWYNVHSKECIGGVFDFRFAILFELAKLKEQICHVEYIPAVVRTYREIMGDAEAPTLGYYNFCELNYYIRENELLRQELDYLKNRLAEHEQQ